jgi:hypothetical protein
MKEDRQRKIFVRQCSVFWRPRQKMLRNDEGRISRCQSALEQLYQNFCTNSSEAGGLLARHDSHGLIKALTLLTQYVPLVDLFQGKQGTVMPYRGG